MNRFVSLLAGLLLVAGCSKHPPTPPPATDATPHIAEVFCSSCHLLPDPALLDRETWTRRALPYMHPWLGLAPHRWERDRSGNVVLPPESFPARPLLTQAQWQSIEDYYASQAPTEPPPQASRPVIQSQLPHFRVRPFPYQRRVPMTGLVKIDAARQRLLVGDSLTHTLEVRKADGSHEFTVQFDSCPISARIQGDGRIDLTLVGKLFPSDQQRGKLLQLVPDNNEVRITKVLDRLRRPTHTAYADLNGDGREDRVVSQFGYHRGRLSWFEQTNDNAFTEHVLLERPGAIRTMVTDLNQDQRPDILVVMGQAWEGIHRFLNQGNGAFEETVVIQQHPLFGYAWAELADFNGDGFPDLLTANGDNGEFQGPPRAFHGVRLYHNDGRGNFSEAWFFPLNGAYKALARDFDKDGDMDVAAISFFPDYLRSPEESFVYLQNRGNGTFAPFSFPEATHGRWVTMDAGDLDGDGDEDIVLGALARGPETVPIPADIKERWRTNPVAVMVLENDE